MSRKIQTKHKPETRRGKMDSTILFICILLLVFGAIMIFDASVYRANEYFNDQYYFLKLQLIWIGISMIPAVIGYFVNPKTLMKLSTPVFFFWLVLMAVMPFISTAINGARGWVAIGPMVFQPTEFFKPIFIAFTALMLGDTKNLASNKKIFLILTAISLGLIMWQPDFGSVMVIGLIAILMYLASDTSYKHIMTTSIVILGTGVVGLILSLFARYRVDRLKTYLDLLLTGDISDKTQSGYQMHQILIGIGSGGFFGKGFGQSRQRFGYLPENTAFTDSTFAIYLEEFGLVGGVILLVAWLIILWRGLDIAQRLEDKRMSLFALGLTVWIVGQALINMAVNVGLIPFTGITMPFMSYGGSSTVVIFFSLAILLNISTYAKNKIDTK